MTALDAMAEEIERLSNLATEGPWDCWDMDEFDYHVFEARRGLSQDCRKSLMAVRWGRSHPEGPNVPRQRDPGRAANFNEMAANAELVCILRNNVPALVAALRSLADMRGACEEAASERMTAEQIIEGMTDCVGPEKWFNDCAELLNELEGRERDLLALVETLTARAEAAEARAETARAQALLEAADMCSRFDDCGPAFIAQRLRDTATRLTAPPPTAKDGGSDA